MKSLQLRGRRQIAEPRKYCLVRVIIFFDVCFLYLFCFSQVGILVKIPCTLFVEKSWKETAVCLKTVEEIKGKQTIKVIWLFELLWRNK